MVAAVVNEGIVRFRMALAAGEGEILLTCLIVCEGRPGFALGAPEVVQIRPLVYAADIGVGVASALESRAVQ